MRKEMCSAKKNEQLLDCKKMYSIITFVKKQLQY